MKKLVLLSALALAAMANSNAQMLTDTYSFAPLDNAVQLQGEGSVASIQLGEPAHSKLLSYPLMLTPFLRV